MRAAQSKGKVDLLALWPWHWWSPPCPPVRDPGVKGPAAPWVVQCKRDGRLPKAEREALIEIAEATAAHAYLAKTGPNGRGVEFIRLKGV